MNRSVPLKDSPQSPHLQDVQSSVAIVAPGRVGPSLRTGRNLDVSGTHHVQWLVSIANLMGLETNSIGNIRGDSGPLPGLV